MQRYTSSLVCDINAKVWQPPEVAADPIRHTQAASLQLEETRKEAEVP